MSFLNRSWLLMLLFVGGNVLAAEDSAWQTFVAKEVKGNAIGVAKLEGRSGATVAGEAMFYVDGDTLHVALNIAQGPAGIHAFHIHEKGDCSAPDAASAGPHFNPSSASHGSPDGTHHVGDLGNITLASDGKAHLMARFRHPKVSDWKIIVGRGLVLHEKSDDFASQPAGNAGGRIACGVIH